MSAAIPPGMPPRASLTVGPVTTEYLRIGSGTPVLVLDPALAATLARGELPARWRDRRLIVPVRISTEALAPRGGALPPLDGWLQGLVEGLGLDRVTVVVAADRALDVQAVMRDGAAAIVAVEVTAPAAD